MADRTQALSRRGFVGLTAGAMFGARNSIIDTHIHLFDTARPEGVPWPPKDNAVLYKPATPARYRAIALPLGITGAIVVEASPWLNDNQWVLDLIAKDTLFVGMIGNLEAGKPEFARLLERYHRNPLFLGIRYGNLWGRDLAVEVGKPAFIADMKLLAKAGLTLDSANPTPSLLKALVQLSDRVPDLRIVVDHLPRMAEESSDVRELAKRKQVFVKVSGVFRRVDNRVPRELSVYQARLDGIFDAFGEDRLLYGSDWPNSDLWRPYEDGLALVQEYFARKSAAAREKYFSGNSIAAYRWKKRPQA